MFSFKRTFARRLTLKIILILFVLMSGTMYLIYDISKDVMTQETRLHYEEILRNTNMDVSNMLTEVSVAVINNEHDFELALTNPSEILNIEKRILENNPRIRSIGISFIENYYPSKGRWYVPYAVKKENGEIETKVVGGPDFDYLNSEWFLQSLESQEGQWSKPFFEGNSGNHTPLVAYLYPIHDKKGRAVAVVGADLSLEWLTQRLKERDKKENERVFWSEETTLKDYNAYSFIIDKEGTYIAHPDTKRILNEKIDKYLTPGDTLFSKLIKNMKEGKNSYDEVAEEEKINEIEDGIVIDGTHSKVFYGVLESANWSMAIVVPLFTVNINGIIMGIIMLIIINLGLILVFILCRFTIRRATKPLVRLAASADEIAKGNFNTELPIIKQKDEIRQLRDSFEDMQLSLSKYMEQLQETTASKTAIESELKIAHGIQMAMLPKKFPPYPERNDIDVYGSLSPAKAVGGDLFDFLIKDDKLLFCIGDVSGKGVPAALVMTVTRALFHSISTHAPAPNHVVMDLNSMMTKGNESMMFVTFFMGELDLKTGLLRYCNAGHDAPYLIGKEIKKLHCDSNIPLGVMAEWQFMLQETHIDPDTIIFLYTDGLSEAEDADHEQFGDVRIFNTAKEYMLETTKSPQALVNSMNNAIRQFVGEAEQSDDLTMLAVQYKNME